MLVVIELFIEFFLEILLEGAICGFFGLLGEVLGALLEKVGDAAEAVGDTLEAAIAAKVGVGMIILLLILGICAGG